MLCKSVLVVVAMVLVGMLAGGCASSADGRTDERVAESSPVTDERARTLVVADGRTGERMTWQQFVRRAGGADAILIGEVHGHPMGLRTAAVLLEDVLEQQDTGRGALALEFFERDQQVHIDDYLADITDGEAFRENADLSASSYPPGHARMLEAAKQRGLPVVAANAPRRYVRLARTDGYDRLRALTNPVQTALFTVPAQLDDGAYRDRFFELMSGMFASHSAGAGADGEPEKTEEELEAERRKMEEQVEAFFRAQQVWDATMAQSVARLLQRGRRPVILVIGQFHTDYEGGTLTRLRELAPNRLVYTVSMVAEEPPTDGVLRDDDLNRADAVVYVGELPASRGN
jgi:uncharacterized iron-regulated protein